VSPVLPWGFWAPACGVIDDSIVASVIFERCAVYYEVAMYDFRREYWQGIVRDGERKATVRRTNSGVWKFEEDNGGVCVPAFMSRCSGQVLFSWGRKGRAIQRRAWQLLELDVG
jgi:hypothetical protein